MKCAIELMFTWMGNDISKVVIFNQYFRIYNKVSTKIGKSIKINILV